MKSYVIVALCLFYFQCLPTLNGQQTLVIGGGEVDISEAPYMLSLRRLGHHICGATVISNYWVVSAAHCLIKSVPSQITLRGGSSNRFLGQLFRAEQIVLHPNFNLNYEFDVAVIRTNESLIANNNIRPIALGVPGTYSPAGSVGKFTGWGMTEVTDIGLSEYLRMTTVTFIDHAECNATLFNFGGTTDNNLCTIGTVTTGYEDFCLGDEGGPLVQDNRVVGIASWSPGCGSAWPSVYTRITIAQIRGFIFNATGL